MSTPRYLSAKEAAEALGVSRATLYAYVSRGLVRSEAVGADRRARRYYAEDVRRLKERKEVRRNPGEAQRALHWGAPLIESQITLIEDGKLYYRGQEAVELATSHSIEQVASLIWTGQESQVPRLFVADEWLQGTFERLRHTLASFASLSPMTRFQTLLPLAAVDDLAAYDLTRERVARTGGRILQLMAALALDCSPMGAGMTQMLQEGWAADTMQAHELINAALVLSADHELNVSSFTVRCVASASSTPYDAVQAGLAALQGVKHGGQTRQVAAFLREVGDINGVRPTIRQRLARGEAIAGFGQKLYPAGDPRASALLQLLSQRYPNAPILALGTHIITELYNATGRHPNIDFALVMLAQLLNLPPHAPLTLFALGRTIGWIGHAIEQYETNRLIRPRARYTGKVPLG